ncbi:unnamed protein product [Acanthoscelides obtectus]|uniref:Major facilitator superfamily (MFS) profile domain-containing protein n=1 Tax=Acanthoscelides obtectus TaxID=200917 RepID=A0A9P0KA46_ACAOB|nr:unnamed protein product [Acanthoscelides obtectus]CAK1646811.1 Sugar transporter ERD6-like 6 [Acanthoscelides obtectus]
MAQGMGMGFISPIYLKMRSNETDTNLVDRPLEPQELSIFAGIINAGAVAGALVAGVISNHVGRKKFFILLAFLMLAGFFIHTITRNLYLHYLARCLIGLGTGGGVVIYLYAAEIAGKHNRATTATISSLMFAIGRLYVYCLGPVVSIKQYCFLCTVPLMLCIVWIILIVPESPFYLVAKKQDAKAEKVLHKLNPAEKAMEQMQDIRVLLFAKRMDWKSLLMDQVSRKAFFICLGVQFLTILSGDYLIVSFIGVILNFPSGHLSGNTYAKIVGGLKVVAGCGIPFAVDHIPRRMLLISCLYVTFVCHLVTGSYFTLKYLDYKCANDMEFLVVLSVTIYGLIQTIGLRMLSGLYVGEMLPNNMKPIAGPIVIACGYSVGLILNVVFPLLEANFAVDYLFYGMSLVCFVGAIFSYLYVPETRKMSLIEIQDILRAKQYVTRL